MFVLYFHRKQPTNTSQTMKVICKDRYQKFKIAAPEGRAVGSVSGDIDRLLGPKTYEELEGLERQIAQKLRSNEPIDVDYWEQLLRSLTVWKAKAKLRKVYQSVIDSRMQILRAQQEEEACIVQRKLELIFRGPQTVVEDTGEVHPSCSETKETHEAVSIPYSREMDPEPLLKLRVEDKTLDMIDESVFLQKVVGYHLFVTKELTTKPVRY